MRSVAVVLGLASVVAVGMVGCTIEPQADENVAVDSAALNGAPACLPSSSECKPCPPNQVCPLIACICEPPPGQTSCSFIAACIIGYTWDDKSCSCVPAKH
jgi:hypothetical protein